MNPSTSWKNMEGHNVAMVELNRNSKEYEEVENLFYFDSSSPSIVKVAKFVLKFNQLRQ